MLRPPLPQCLVWMDQAPRGHFHYLSGSAVARPSSPLSLSNSPATLNRPQTCRKPTTNTPMPSPLPLPLQSRDRVLLRGPRALRRESSNHLGSSSAKCLNPQPKAEAILVAYDLMEADGQDLRPEPLEERVSEAAIP